jgi:hypothetical protein
VKLTEAAAEARVGEEAAPAPGDERGADEIRGLVRRQAAEHFLQGLIRQRARHGAFARPSSEPGDGGARVTLLDQGMEEESNLRATVGSPPYGQFPTAQPHVRACGPWVQKINVKTSQHKKKQRKMLRKSFSKNVYSKSRKKLLKRYHEKFSGKRLLKV